MSNWLFWGVCFILFLPIIILPPNFQPSGWTRESLFKIILTILISFILFRFFYKKDISISLPKKGWLFYLPIFTLFGFLFFSIISTIFSQDPRFSIFGSPVRTGGLLNLLFFFIFAIFLTLFIKGDFWNKLIKINFAAGVLASILAFVQYFGLFKNIFINWEAGGPPSFLGNSTFLAIYMIFLVFSSFSFLISEENKKQKVIYAGLFLLFLFTIVITGSRAVYIGILAGFAFYFLFFPSKITKTGRAIFKWINPKKLKIFKITSAIFAFLLLLALIYVNISPKLPNVIENNKQLSYFAHNRLSFKIVVEDLAGTRLSAWKITLQAIKEKPVLGWGLENFYIGFEKYYDPANSNLQRLWWDRPHNIFLEIFANSGIFALVFYVAFWVILLWQLQLFKNKNENGKDISFAHGLQAMFIGYLVALFFNFDSFSTYLISFFFAGYALYLISLNIEKIEILPSTKTMPFKKPVAIIFLILISLFIWFWNIKPLYINAKIDYANNLSKSKQCKKALYIENNSNWEKSGILKSYAILKYSDIIRNCIFTEPEKEIEYSQKALSLLKIASNIQPKFSRTWLFMGGFANVLAAREENPDEKNKLLLESKNYLNKAIELSPKRQEIFIEIEKNYIVAQDYQTMKKLAQDCIKIDESQGECYWYLGISEIFLGDQENGKKHIQESLDKPHANPSYIQLGIAYISQKNYKDAVWAYDMLVGTDPDNASYHAVLAFLLREIGDYERANKEALKVFKLQPENKETIEFIKLLLNQDPNNPNFHVSLAFIYRELGEEEKALEELLIVKSIYLQLIAKNPERSGYHFGLAGVYKELGEYEKSFEEALLAIKLRPAYKIEVEDFISTFPGNYWPKYVEATRQGPPE